MSEPRELLPDWIVDELRRPLPANAERKARIMSLVRALPAANVRPHRARRWRSRPGLLAPAAAMAMAAGILLAIGPLRFARGGSSGAPREGRAEIIGDTVVGTLHDTLRLVRFVLDAPAARRVALVDPSADPPRLVAPLARSSAGAWSAVVPLAPGRYGYAFAVDDTRHVRAPAVDVPPLGGRPAARADGDST